MPNPKYAGRICWNSKRWIFPTGEASKLERDPSKPRSKQPYSVKYGYGHEEWLFNFDWVHGGCKYAYIQGVGRSYKKLAGQTIDILLFTIAGRNERYYVGELKNCEVLTADQAKDAYKAYITNRWLAAMKRQIKDVDGLVHHLDSPLKVFNIRFKPEDAIIYDSLIAVDKGEYISTLKRYTLTALDTKKSKKALIEWPTRTASTKKQKGGKKFRKGSKGRYIDPVHDQMKDELESLLINKYGKSAVKKEENYVDLKITLKNRIVLIEIKSDSQPQYALRQAIGQLLEYEHRLKADPKTRRVELIVAAPGSITDRESQYLDHLNNHWKLPIKYVCFRSGIADVDI